MASIFRRSRKKGTPYLIQYRDHEGNRQTVKGFTDRGLTEQLAAKLEMEARLRATGLVDPEQERIAEREQTELAELIEQFKQSLGEKSSQYILHTISRLKKIMDGCRFSTLADLNKQAVVGFMQTLRKKENLGPRTNNHYLQAIDVFCNWCVEQELLVTNPISRIKRMNVEVDVRHPRRALTEGEFQQLISSARGSGISIQRFSGEQRARIYILAYMTGLRRQELGSLTPRSFDFDGSPPILTVQAAVSKHRRKDVLPLHPELVELLREWTRGLKPKEPLFPKLAKRKTWLMVQKDLERVGIPYQTEEGIADFHAAGRHTHITELLRNGASLPEVQRLARHSDIKMTMRYAHIGIEDQARALGQLPTSALQMRCISGVVEGHSLTSLGTETTAKERRNPRSRKGFGNECHELSKTDLVEAGGHQ